MRIPPLIIASLFFIAIVHTAMAQPPTAPNDSAAELKDLLDHLFKKSLLQKDLELGYLDLKTYTTGTSHCTKRGLVGRLIPHLLPFQADTTEAIGLEAVSHIHYQWPGELHFNITSLQTNNRRKGKDLMNELYEGLLPSYAMKRRGDFGNTRSFVLPFYDEGPKRYDFKLLPVHDSIYAQMKEAGLRPDTMDLCLIGFKPKHYHQTLLTGNVLIDKKNYTVMGIDCSGHLELTRFHTQIHYAPDSLHGNVMLPHCSTLNIRYRLLNTYAQNDYYTIFKFIDFLPLDSINTDSIPLDLTPYYKGELMRDLDFEGTRPIPISPYIDSLINTPPPSKLSKSERKKKAINRGLEEFSEALFDGTRFGPEDNRLRIYGPLDPSYLGWDKFNGFTFRERARWTKSLPGNSKLFMRGELGYAFRLKEWRYRLFTEWTYIPERRGRWTLDIYRNTSSFSNKFIRTVNEHLKAENAKDINFDSLGIDYYKRYEVELLHSIEIRNGLMLHTGLLFTYRNPVRHGVHKISAEKRDQLIDSYYSDFAPYIRVEWTPRQYYWYNKGYKEYIHSPAPTMAFEVSRAIPGVLGTDSNYGRMEFDMQQTIRIRRTQFIAYHFGMGKFFNQKGEYFINYRYFERSRYPTTWEDDRIGGTFHMLDDYWYASSPSYVQAHFMYETPFGLIHKIKPLSRFVIKERLYLGSLWTEGHSFYNEIGYGIDNNFLNVGVFVGFKDAEYFDFGFKFRIEIGRHI